MVSSMFLTVSVERRRPPSLSAPSSMISPSFSSATCLGFLHRLGAFLQHLLAARGQQRRSLAGKARALGGKLQAGGQPRNVPPAQVHHHLAEMAQHHAGAGADQRSPCPRSRRRRQTGCPGCPSAGA